MDVGCAQQFVQHEHRIVCDEEHHGVLADVVHHRDARDVQCNEQSADAAERGHRIDGNCPPLAGPLVRTHRVFAVMADVQPGEDGDEQDGDDDGVPTFQTLHDPTPHTSEEEEEDAEENEPDVYEFEDVDPEIFRDPTLMVKWLRKHGSGD